MSDRDQDGPKGQEGPIGQDGKRDAAATPKQPPQLFGHRSGAKPWEPGQRAGQRSGQAPAPPAAPAISAPYPRDAQYAPRPLEKAPVVSATKQNPTPEPTDSIFSDVDDEEELTKLHPNYKLIMRIGAIFVGFVVLIVGLAIDGAMLAEEVPVPFGVASVPALLLAAFIVIRVPMSRYNARGYQISRDRLRVVRGILWRSDTIVPFGRIQHIDVDQGPIERALGIATLTLHTAGSHNASVSLPGLGHSLAVQMREEIRAHIKRESM